MTLRDSTWQYVERVWNFVVVPCLVDIAAAAAVVTVVALVGAAFVVVGGSAVGLNLRHVRTAAAILGCIYAIVVLGRTLWRHWQLAWIAIPESSSSQQEVLQEDARPSTSSD